MGESATSEPMKQAWQEVAEGFTSLGRLMKERYRSSEEADAATGGDSAGGDSAEKDADAKQAARDAAAGVRAALEQLTVAGRELGDRVAEVAHDDEVKAQAKHTASSFDDALSATVNLITEQLSAAFTRSDQEPEGSGDSGGPADPPPWDPPR